MLFLAILVLNVCFLPRGSARCVPTPPHAVTARDDRPARILKLKAEKPAPSGPPAPTPRTGATIQGERGQRPGPEGAGPCLTRAVATQVGVSIHKNLLSFELTIFTLRHTSVTENKAHPGRFLAGLHTMAQTARRNGRTHIHRAEPCAH